MRVLVLNRFSFPFYSGAGVAADRLCKVLASDGNFVCHFSFINSFYLKRSQYCENYIKLSVPLFSFDERSSKFFSKKYTILFELYILLYLIINNRKYDIVYYASLTRLNFITIALTKFFKLKVVVKISGNSDDLLSNISCFSGLFSTIKVFKSVDRFIAINMYIYDDILSLGINRVVRTHNFVDINENRISEEFLYRVSRDSDMINFVFSGIVSKRKGADTLLKFWREWSCNKNVLLHLVGPVEVALKNDLNFEHSKIVIHGSQNLEYVYKLYRDSDVFILPTSSEGMPNAMIEALLFSMPCVVTNIEGITDDLVARNVIFPIASDLSNLENCIEAMYMSKELRLNYSKNAFQWASDNLKNGEILKSYFKNL